MDYRARFGAQEAPGFLVPTPLITGTVHVTSPKIHANHHLFIFPCRRTKDTELKSLISSEWAPCNPQKYPR